MVPACQSYLFGTVFDGTFWDDASVKTITVVLHGTSRRPENGGRIELIGREIYASLKGLSCCDERC
jgi:hypothetical protein